MKCILIILFLAGSGLLWGCPNEKNKNTLSDPFQMNAPGYSIGVPQGAASMIIVEQKFPQSKIEYYQTVPDGYLAVKQGKIDAFAFGRHTLQYIAARDCNLAVMDEKIGDQRIVVGTARGQDELMEKVNAFIKQYRGDGTYEDMYNRWILGKNARIPDLPETKAPVLTLKIGTDGLNEPMNFYANGELTGFDIEFAKRLALFLNAKITFQTMDFSALVIAAQTGKVDLLVADLNATPERGRNMLFSDTYVDSETALLVRRDRLIARDDKRIDNISQLSGKRVGVITGAMYENVLKETIPTATPVYFSTFTDQIEAVRTGKIDAFLVDDVVAKDMIRQTTGVTYLQESLSTNEYAFAFARERVALQVQVNAALRKMGDEGTLRELAQKWFGEDERVKVLPDIGLPDGKDVIRFATNSNCAPFAYMKDGRMVGYDIETAMIIARKLGRGLKITDMEFSAIIPALKTGKSDMAGGFITITPERSRSVLFSSPNYTGGTIAVVASQTKGVKPLQTDGFWMRMDQSFKRTFVIEDRYKLILRGLGVTLVISLLSAVFGTLLGFAICMMRRARTKWMHLPAKVFIRVIQGTPIVVLLMILYYIVFGGVDINAVAVAVVGFSINFAAYVSEMMRTGIETVDRGQHEAAYAIGFNPFQVFCKITFPQAARHVLPVFKGEFISMLKMTSVVGYIAIQDLTKMSDIIRSRTYEAFFPLIATALIYFVIAYAMAYLLSRVEMSVDPKRRKRIVKGI
ncbi:MAG: ABC transporter permease subunit [Syntrophales bacterium]|nr:ABC transporter permease subunit [Syntrophales bacterium]